MVAGDHAAAQAVVMVNAPQHGAQCVIDELPAWNLDGTDGTSSQDAIGPAEMAGQELVPVEPA